MQATCPRCDASLAADVRFCTACGLDLATAAERDATDGAAETSAERRRVSVLFVDLENFTGLAESLDPEEVRRVQSRYFEAARAVVAAHDGTIEKFIGDAVMAVWGAPVAHEDDAERAVRAAITIVDEVSRLGGAAADRGLTARAAVASGVAAVTVGDPGQGMVAGDLVNRAARLQTAAPPGGVLVDTTTRELAPEAAAYETVGSLVLKGSSTQTPAFSATTRGREAIEMRGGHGGPFVGRERELKELIALYEGVVEDRLCRLVLVSGIAGIGKSRLAWEFGEWIEARPEAVAWHAGRSPAYGEGITFAAVAEMVKRRIRVSDDDPPSVARRQLAASLAELVRDETEREWMLPRVGVLLGRDEDPAFERDELFAAWRRFFERVADRTPAVMVFEDVQWADPALLDFIEHLATWSRDHRLLVLALARPELVDRRPGWGSGLSRFTSIHLERLSDEAMRKLLAGRAPDLAPPLVGSILQRAGGVPLYAVEVLGMLAEREAGPPSGGTPDIPDSLAGLIAARIDALPAPERRLLLSAAVLGRRFRHEALVAVSGSEPAHVREWVETLVRRDLLEVDEEVSSPGRGGVGFVQDLVRDVAYRTLSHSDRRSLHIAAARYLESRDDDDAAEALAHHLLEAHALAPEHADARRLARRAVGALRTAAGDAMRLHVPLVALDHLERALDLVETPEQRATLLEEAAAAARAGARLDTAEMHLRELIELRAGGDAAPAARARAQLASVLLMAQRNEPALRELEAAVAAMDGQGNDPAGAEVAAQVARAHVLVGDDRAGLEWAERAVSASEGHGVEAVTVDAIITRGTARVRLGDERAGLADLQLAIERSQAAGLLATELRARNNLAWLVVADDPRTTLETARQGFDRATAMGIGDLAAQLGEVACAAALDTGDWGWALLTTDEIVRGPVPEANRINLIVNAAVIGALCAMPDRVAALETLEPLPDETDPQVVSGLLHARAWSAFLEGEFAESGRLAGEAAAGTFGAERVQQLALRARSGLWAGDRDAVAGAIAGIEAENVAGRVVAATSESLAAGLAALDGADAVTAYVDASDVWRSLELPVHRVLCLMDAERLLGSAAPHRDQVGPLLEALGASGLIRLRETLATA